MQTASLTDACGSASQRGPSASEEVINCRAMAERHAEVGVWVHTSGDDVATGSVYHSDILWAADVEPHLPKACRRQLVQCVHALMLLCIAYFMTPCSQSTSACWHLSSFTTMPPLMSRAAWADQTDPSLHCQQHNADNYLNQNLP